MTADSPLEELLRASRLDYGHIQLFRDASGWQASVYHYEPKTLTHDGRVSDDPVATLRLALVEDDRRSRDLERRYAAAPKQGAAVADDFEDMFG